MGRRLVIGPLGDQVVVEKGFLRFAFKDMRVEKDKVLMIVQDAKKKDYYAVVEVSEEEFNRKYRFYRNVLPPRYRTVESLKVPACPVCGAATSVLDEGDDDRGPIIYCKKCRRKYDTDFIDEPLRYIELWRTRPVDLSTVEQVRGEYWVLRERRAEGNIVNLSRYYDFLPSREGKEVVVDGEIEYYEFVGCVEFDEERRTNYGVYRMYKLGEETVTTLVRRLTEEEVEEIQRRIEEHHRRHQQPQQEETKAEPEEAKASEGTEKDEAEAKTERRARSWWGRTRDRARAEIEKRFSGLPVEVEFDGEDVYVKLTKWVERKDFERYVETCKRMGMEYDSTRKAWRTSVYWFTPRVEVPG